MDHSTAATPSPAQIWEAPGQAAEAQLKLPLCMSCCVMLHGFMLLRVTLQLYSVVHCVLLHYVAQAMYHIILLHDIVLGYRAMVAIEKSYNFV